MLLEILNLLMGMVTTMWKVVIALFIRFNGELLEHTYKTSISECLKKRIMET
jgi:hypothetical protein